MPTSSNFGKTLDGTEVQLYTLTNAHGLKATITTYGGTLTSLLVPDKNGKLGDVVLGFDDLGGYTSATYLREGPYFGALIGRYGNRIKQGKFTLNGQTYQVPVNNGPNSLHGGTKGFDKVVWQATPGTSAAGQTLTLRYASAAGEQGYPGALQVQVVYTLTAEDGLRLDYTATTNQPTVLNLTNHSYFNLAGEDAGSALGHMVTLAADAVLETDAEQIPTGRILPVAGTPFDFRTPTALGARIRTAHPQLALAHGYDHTYVLGGDGTLRAVAQAVDPASGRSLTVATTQPGLQLYTANMLDGTVTGDRKSVV